MQVWLQKQRFTENKDIFAWFWMMTFFLLHWSIYSCQPEPLKSFWLCIYEWRSWAKKRLDIALQITLGGISWLPWCGISSYGASLFNSRRLHVAAREESAFETSRLRGGGASSRWNWNLTVWDRSIVTSSINISFVCPCYTRMSYMDSTWDSSPLFLDWSSRITNWISSGLNSLD